VRRHIVAEERALSRFVTDAAPQERVRRGEIHGQTLRLNELDVFLEGEGPSAGGDDCLLEIVGGAKDVPLALSEVRLPMLAEDVLDRHLLRGLDELVEIEERRVDARREFPADRGLAGAHEADDVDLHP